MKNIDKIKYDFLKSEFFFNKKIEYRVVENQLLCNNKIVSIKNKLFFLYIWFILLYGFLIDLENKWLLAWTWLFFIISSLYYKVLFFYELWLEKYKKVFYIFFFIWFFYSSFLLSEIVLIFSRFYIYLLLSIVSFYIGDFITKIYINFKFYYYEIRYIFDIYSKIIFWDEYKYEANFYINEDIKKYNITKYDVNNKILENIKKFRTHSIIFSIFVIFNLITWISVFDIIDYIYKWLTPINNYLINLSYKSSGITMLLEVCLPILQGILTVYIIDQIIKFFINIFNIKFYKNLNNII